MSRGSGSHPRMPETIRLLKAASHVSFAFHPVLRQALAQGSGGRGRTGHGDLRHPPGVRPVRCANFDRTWRRRPDHCPRHCRAEPDLGIFIAAVRRDGRPDRGVEGGDPWRGDLYRRPALHSLYRLAWRRIPRSGADRAWSRQRRHLDCHRRRRAGGAAGPPVHRLRAGDEFRLLRTVRPAAGHANDDRHIWMAAGTCHPVFPDGGDDGDGARHAHRPAGEDRRGGARAVNGRGAARRRTKP